MHTAAREQEAACEPPGLDLGSIAVAFLGALGLVLTVALGVQALYLHAAARERALRAAGTRPAEVSAAAAEQEEQLRSVRWVDEERGVVSIPIELAMEKVVKRGGRP